MAMGKRPRHVALPNAKVALTKMGGSPSPRPRHAHTRYIIGLILAGSLALYAVHLVWNCEKELGSIMWSLPYAALASLAGLVSGAGTSSTRTQASLDDCPGYLLTDVQRQSTGLTADLKLAGPSCNIYGTDLSHLTLQVTYESQTRLHVKIFDPAEQVYQISEDVFPRPGGTSNVSDLDFAYTEAPFSFSVVRKSNNETLFTSAGSNIIFESQYLRIRTALPDSPNLYGLGEHADQFRLKTEGYVRTLWNQDAPGVPSDTNLYGSHPVYFDHRETGTHGVFFLNSNGMDIKIDNNGPGTQYLEYNTLGGIIDLYFISGQSPLQVSQQYAEIVGSPAMMPYFGLGFHQCKYGYRDVYEVAAVIANYSAAAIPLETMWTDIDYMQLRRTFTLDAERFPLQKMRELVDYLHAHQQHYVLMVDPAVWHGDYQAYNNGVENDALLKLANGSIYTGVVWPGPASFPDWFHPNTQQYWNNEFLNFFGKDDGVDIDALWIDMNEASNFCFYPCSDPAKFAAGSFNPPNPPPVRPNAGYPIPGFPSDFQPGQASPKALRRQSSDRKGLSGRDLINPPYRIRNGAGSISNKTITTDVQNWDGTYQYDTHNLYGSAMSVTSQRAMLNRRPGRRPLVITRSTFAGAGKAVGHWLGDNLANWGAYQTSISQIIMFSSLFQVPMVGADVCGYGFDTTINLCQRWATLGAFYPFFRNHAADFSKPHEFYRWPEVADTAREAINRRMRLLDYLYTAFYHNYADGTPVLSPLFFKYPQDTKTFGIGFQFFYGEALLISPVTEGDSTQVTYYLPPDTWYDYFTGQKIISSGTQVTDGDVPFSSIPIHIKSGTIIPQRVESANTTTELRKKDFELLIAVASDGTASGQLYLDDGDSLDPPNYSLIKFWYENGAFNLTGHFGYEMSGINIFRITVLGADKRSSSTSASGPLLTSTCDQDVDRCVFQTSIGLDGEFKAQLF